MPIINAIASLIAWFAANKVDDILGKWIAYITIAWNNAATERGKSAYREVITQIQGEVEIGYGSWDEWRKKVGVKK